MKLSFPYSLLISLSLIVSCQSIAQDDTPKAVQKSFEAQYPGESDPDWRIDKNGYYEAHFKKKGDHFRADYAKDGSWIETEQSIEKDDLPKAIRKILNDKYEDVKIYELEKVQHHSKGLFYDVELKIDGKKQDIEFQEDGTVINS